MGKLTRDLFIPCLDTSEAKDGSAWVPIDLSTQFELSFEPNEETYSYICYKNDSNEVTGYAPTMDQEIVLDNTNPMYKFAFPLCMSMPTGSDAKVPILLVYPDMTTGEPTRGMVWWDGAVSPDNLNTVDGLLAFGLKFNGDATEGTVAITTTTSGEKKITFTADTATSSTKSTE